MNANHLLDAIGDTKDQYILSAVQSREGQKRHSFKKPLLAAAIIALMLMLVGCAAAVVLHLQDMKAGESTYTKKYDEFGKRVAPTEVTVELVTPHGLRDSPMQMATMEWQAFLKQYDPDHKLMADTNENGIPDNYYFTYSCYTWEMAEKLEEIVQKYDLKMLDRYIVAQRYQKDVMYEALDIEGVIRSGVQAEIEESTGIFYPNGNFESELTFTLTGENAAWTSSCYGEYDYAKKDTFRPLLSGVVAGDFEQWNYTAADGTELLLVLKDGGEGEIYADTGDATVFISIYPDIPGFYPRDESQIPTRQALEQMADLFDYRLRPQTFDVAEVRPKLDAAEAEYQAQNVFVMPEYRGFGEYLNDQPGLDRLSYCFMDYDGDGEEEMLTSYADNTIFAVVSLKDGLAEEYVSGTEGRICKGAILEDRFEQPFNSYVRYEYFKAGEVEGRLSYHHDDLQFVVGIEYKDGVWHKYTEPWNPFSEPPVCSEVEAQAIRDQYPPVDMGWKSVLDYPVDDGTTLAQYNQIHDPLVTEADRLQLYKEFALRRVAPDGVTHYGLRDINGDGKTDILLGYGPNGPFTAATEERGTIRWILPGAAWLSEGNVIYRIVSHMGYTEEDFYDEYEEYTFYRIEWPDKIPLDCVRHNLATDVWGLNEDGPEITEGDARAILDKYPPVELNLKPISELE